MTRDAEIQEQAKLAKREFIARHNWSGNQETGFKEGAKWADQHPKPNLVDIDKACEWLSNIPIEDMNYKYNDFDTSEGWYKMIEDFKNYMKGE